MAIIDLELRRPIGPQYDPPNPYGPSGIRMNDPNPNKGGGANVIGESEITSVGQNSQGEAFSSLLNEIVLPNESADEETKQVGRWSPKELRPRHREMMRRIIEGASQIEIAQEMGISLQAVTLVCSSVIFKEELKLLEDDLNLNVIQRAEEMSNEALDKLKMLMRKARSESLQASCAERVLGIAGYSKIEKKQLQVISGADVIRELNRRRREAAQERVIGNTGPSSPTTSPFSEDC